MPARTDHDRRDAQHAARATIAIALGRYIRRIQEESYGRIEQFSTEHDGSDAIDWSAVGAACANRALASYGVTVAAPERAIEGAVEALESGDDPADYTAAA